MRSGLAAAALLLVSAAACHRGGDEPRIVFQSDRSGRWAIYSVRTDGSDLAQIAEVGGWYAGFAVWSRGGERVFIPVDTTTGRRGVRARHPDGRPDAPQ